MRGLCFYFPQIPYAVCILDSSTESVSAMSLHTDSPLHRITSTDHLAQLANTIHSSSETESQDALNELARQASNDAARALIDAYRDCHWRDTRIQILRALGRNRSQRAIEFLLRTASEHFPTAQSDGRDTGLCQESLLALGDTRDPAAASFLLHRLSVSPAYMKSWIVNALSRIPDLRSAPLLHELMDSKECEEHPQLMRNIVVAFSEMKDTTSIPKLIELLRQRSRGSGQSPDSTALTLLSAIARLSRKQVDVQQFERYFEGEMLHQQFYQQCLTQVTFRQQWTLEDYLSKIFFSDKIHYALPFELNSFSTSDVIEALSMFVSEEKHFQRLCLVLGSVLDAEQLLSQFIRVDALSQEQTLCLIEHLGLQRCPAARLICIQVKELHLKHMWLSPEPQPLVAAWLRAVVCIYENPQQTLLDLLQSDDYNHAHDRQRIEVINAFVTCMLVYRAESTWPKKLLQFIQERIQLEKSTQVLGRWLRALGEMALNDLKWTDELRTRVAQTTALHSSAFLMLDNQDSHQNTPLLRSLQPALSDHSENKALFLRACTALKNSEKDLPTDEMLKNCLASDRVIDALAALAFLSRHPRQSCLDNVLSLCRPESSETRLVIGAIVAARAFRHEKFIQPLEKCLLSSAKVISGRALDALLHIEHPQANTVVVRYLISHLNNPMVCDKVLRSMKAPAAAQIDLAELLEQATHHTGSAALKDDLLDLAARLRSGQSGETAAQPSTDTIRKIDLQLDSKITGYAQFPDSVKASLRSAELPLNQPELFEGTVDKSASVVQYCKALDLTLEREFGQKILFPKMEQQLHVFQNILHQAELDTESPNLNLVLRHFRAEHVFDLYSLPLNKMSMVSRSILNGRILRERSQVIDGLKAWGVLILMFSGHERLWGSKTAQREPILYPMLAHKLVMLQDLRNPAAHRQTMLALAPLSEIRKEVFDVFALMRKAFE